VSGVPGSASPGAPDAVVWRSSSFSSGQGGNCVECAGLADGRVAVRDSRAPGEGPLVFTRAAIATWVSAVKVGVLDGPT
jgi:hypothetical protein